MRVNHTKNRREAGKRIYAQRVAEVGLDNIKRMGAEYAKRRSKESYQNTVLKTEAGAEICKRGGLASRRGRVFTAETEMFDWEWARLRELANTAAGRLRLNEEVDAADQTYMRSVTLQEYQENGDWIAAMTSALDHPDWYEALGAEIESARQIYTTKLKLGKRITKKEEVDFKTIRNLRAAWLAAGKIKKGT